ncbi:M48 family metallopeptidase [Desulforamulus ruminis]|uniref:Ste24 endopeptidase n=1 Tax=Desulforamulus ruminis (strain ATCC 23193 / DSM 2154 / NCIMB 8452 / DL) TaxID=696281 RepID=F6DS75_DESRL|nr:M48 family metallopeptidase [Desulforamulus ruminis]AEG58837.1 Ste24 endopeptidase [Desulforamulus ruminis DSM 2154]
MNAIWPLLILITAVFSLLYLWYSLFPGRIQPEVFRYFSAEQVAAGREYNLTQRLLFITGFMVQILFLLWLVFSGRGMAFARWAQQLAGGSYWGGILVFFVSLWLMLSLVKLPFTLYSSYFLQKSWGFSTQTLGSWWLDYFKYAGLDLILSALGVLLLFWILGRWPGIWWLLGAGFVSLWLVLQSYLWPVLVSPLFNQFVPAKDPAIISMVQELSQKAGVPVDEVLVMDASQRTTKANAYFTGLGATKRIVLYDTLLKDYPADQIKAVVAHEMAHWRQGHIVKGLTLGILGNFLVWGLLFLVLRGTFPPTPLRYPPQAWAVILLFFVLISFISSPLQNYISRDMEKEADRVSVWLTGDAPAAVRLQINLASKNLSDLSPPAFIQWFSYSHPPALTRIRILQEGAQ